MKRERERIRRTRWQPSGGGKNKKYHLSGNAEVVPEPPKRSCQYLSLEKGRASI